jgi:hypothetical protein
VLTGERFRSRTEEERVTIQAAAPTVPPRQLSASRAAAGQRRPAYRAGSAAEAIEFANDGVKASGLGREGGHDAIYEFLEPKYLAITIDEKAALAS